MSTTDTIPNYPNKMVTKSEVTWAYSTTITGAYNYLEKWAREHSYDAIVGVQFATGAKSDGELQYVIYGTAVTWEY
jgi:uncharacterized protein YbjQ (UPF0145 family)